MKLKINFEPAPVAVPLYRLVRHPLLWGGVVMLAIAMLGGISGAWGFAAGILVTIASRESRVPNAAVSHGDRERQPESSQNDL